MRFGLIKKAFLLGLVCALGSCAPLEQGAVEEAEPVAAVDEQFEVEVDEPIYVPEMAKSFEEEWPTRFSRNDVINSAQSKSFPFFEAALQKDCGFNANFFWQENHELRDEIEHIARSLVTVFCDELSKDIPVIVGDYDFLKTTLQEQSLETDDFGGICGSEKVSSSVWGCALFGTGWFRGSVEDDGLRRLVAHELFHLVQDAMSPEPDGTRIPPDHPQKVPNWLTEGSAMFFEATFNDFISEDKTWEYWKYQKSVYEIEPGSKMSIDMTGLEDSYSTKTYNIGQFASEYLVANSDFETLMNTWRLRDQGYSFDEAFVESFGISRDEFYGVMAQVEVLANE